MLLSLLPFLCVLTVAGGVPLTSPNTTMSSNYNDCFDDVFITAELNCSGLSSTATDGCSTLGSEYFPCLRRVIGSTAVCTDDSKVEVYLALAANIMAGREAECSNNTWHIIAIALVLVGLVLGIGAIVLRTLAVRRKKSSSSDAENTQDIQLEDIKPTGSPNGEPEKKSG